MGKVNRRTRLTNQPPKAQGWAILVFKGILVSLTVSVACILFLSVVSLVTEAMYLENYIKYIMVAINMISIFIGSVYATQKAESMGLVIGMLIGTVYVLISVGVGMEISMESISLLALINKFVAGIGAGALGGFIGVNMS